MWLHGVRSAPRVHNGTHAVLRARTASASNGMDGNPTCQPRILEVTYDAPLSSVCVSCVLLSNRWPHACFLSQRSARFGFLLGHIYWSTLSLTFNPVSVCLVLGCVYGPLLVCALPRHPHLKTWAIHCGATWPPSIPPRSPLSKYEARGMPLGLGTEATTSPCAGPFHRPPLRRIRI